MVASATAFALSLIIGGFVFVGVVAWWQHSVTRHDALDNERSDARLRAELDAMERRKQ